jgi:NADH-quinone oxidoreductase subunit J
MEINWHSFFFYFFALLAGGFAVAVAASNNIVRMACCLVAALGAVAGLFFLAGADFLGAVQLLVYVGGTMVLLVFGVMLTARGPFVSMKTGAGQWLIALLASGALLIVLMQVSLGVTSWAGPNPAASKEEVQATSAPLGLALLGVRVDQSDQPRTDLSGYLLVFELLSVHLFVVLIGAAYLARASSRKSKVESRESRDTTGSRDSTLDPRPSTLDPQES